MVHVFKHTMSIDFINTIAIQLARRDTGKETNVVLRNIYKTMKSSGFIEYCLNNLPQLMIKSTCKISSFEKDPDAAMTANEILNKALEKLSESKFENVDHNAINRFKEDVVPFVSKYMSTYTAQMHYIMVIQLKRFVEQSRLFTILKLLAQKAVGETTYDVKPSEFY